MATRKPLVLVGGEIQQLQAGDTIGATSDTGQASLTNSDPAATAIGDVCYIFGADAVKKAKADAAGTAQGLCIALAVISSASAGMFQFNGIVTGLSGLTAGATYYLSDATAGLLTTTPPSTLGHYVVRLGIALSTTEFNLRPERFILL
jgi:hypothetical protein